MTREEEKRQVRLLSEDVANKIAAGEVVERPSSVVKELVENSLDAGASRVVVEIREGGRKLILVSDDGCGMEREDALMALQRHATSKIRTAGDISDVRTLGFRGEAIPSIASVSRFEMVTCPRSGGPATKIKVFGGELKDSGEGARSFGTTISVSNLFYCVPARAKFLKTDATEMGHIARFMQNAVLSHPLTGFRYEVDGTEVFDLPPQPLETPFLEAALARLRQLRGHEFSKALLPVQGSKDGITAEGFVSPWTVCVSNRQEMLFFVNKRPVRCPWLGALIRRAYGTLLSPERYPYVFLYLSLDPETVDVNVHPAKLDVRFRSEHQVQDLIARSVSEALRKDMAPPEISLQPKEQAKSCQPASGGGEYRTAFARPEEKPLMTSGRLSIEDWKRIYGKQEDRTLEVREEPPKLEYSAAPKTETPQMGLLSSARFLAQAGGMYILAEMEGKGIGIVDQHAAHERINYEKAVAAFELKEPPSQALLMPESLEFPPDQHAALSAHLEDLKRAGFGIEPFGARTFKVDAVPSFLEVSDLPSLFSDMASDLALLGSTARSEEVRRRMALVMVCRKSIKFHHALSPEDCQALLDQLMAANTPWTCPHGRPTIIMLTFAELEKRFGRGGL